MRRREREERKRERERREERGERGRKVRHSSWSILSQFALLSAGWRRWPGSLPLSFQKFRGQEAFLFSNMQRPPSWRCSNPPRVSIS